MESRRWSTPPSCSAAACEIARGTAERVRDRQAVTPRGGVAIGELIARGGDYYGPVVDLSSRLADLAIPHEILVTDQIRADAGAAAAPPVFQAGGQRMIKGFDDPIAVFTAERP